MPYALNEIMTKQGYVRAVDAATAFSKSLTTIHRWALAGRVKSARDGRALYLLVDSIIEMFVKEKNAPMAAVARKLKKS